MNPAPIRSQPLSAPPEVMAAFEQRRNQGIEDLRRRGFLSPPQTPVAQNPPIVSKEEQQRMLQWENYQKEQDDKMLAEVYENKDINRPDFQKWVDRQVEERFGGDQNKRGIVIMEILYPKINRPDGINRPLNMPPAWS